MIGLLTPAWGQLPIQFDTVRFGPVSYAIGYSVFEVEAGFQVFNLQKFSGTSFQDLVVSKFDVGGGFMSEVHHASYSADWIGSSSPAVTVYDGFVSGVAHFGFGAVDSLFVYKFNGSGDTVWTRFIGADSSLVHRATARTLDGDLLLAGTRDPGRKAYIFHLDSVGNIMGYHPYDDFNGEDVAEGKDGRWYLCGIGNQTNNYGRAILLRSDTLGQQLWRYTDWSMYGRFVSMIALQDGGVVGLGSRNPLGEDQRASLTKLDTAGVVVWFKDIWQTDDPNWVCNLNCGFEYPDSTLIVAGTLRSMADRDKGILFKLEQNGETLWHRFYSHYPGAAYGKDQIFWDVKPTSDGGMVLTGETNSDDYDYAQLWLLKLDSMGCLVPGCGSVGVQEYTDLFNGKLVVAPNPARDLVNVALDLGEGIEVSGQVRALLLDATGRVVLEQPVQQNVNKLSATVDVSALSGGKYYLHLRDAKTWLAGSKLVVE